LKVVRLGVAVAHLLFAERAFDSAGHGIAEPDHGSEKNQRHGELNGLNHESPP
jgi:hypothetical protein